MERRRLVRVPASSANLGPGFDVLAAALALHMELEVEETGRFAVETDLDVAARPLEPRASRAFERLHPADGFTFRIRSEIPLSGGLGSSAAAIVAGLAAADHMFELDADVLGHANELEGHPDNVAAALLRRLRGLRGGPGRALRPAGGPRGASRSCPASRSSTEAARAALPAEVPMADAVFNVAHASLLMLGLARGDWDLVSRGLDDRLHQPRRAHLYPRSMELVTQARHLGALGRHDLRRRPDGAGVVALRADRRGLRPPAREVDGWARVMRLPFEVQGADVRAL